MESAQQMTNLFPEGAVVIANSRGGSHTVNGPALIFAPLHNALRGNSTFEASAETGAAAGLELNPTEPPATRNQRS
jgi:hypothetical protein